MLVLVTGAAGKVGQHFLRRFLDDPRWPLAGVRAFAHNRQLPRQDRLETVSGSMADREAVERAVTGVTHVLHLATCKDTPEDVIDVTVKGLFWLLEACRESKDFSQFILVGGDAGVGHFFYRADEPITEVYPHRAYPGCYALSKVLEEVMLAQYYVQYGLNGCCLRAPWIMEKDDFKYTLSFGNDVFGGPVWRDLVGPERATEYVSAGTVPLLMDADGKPLRRNFVHVDDLVSAILAALDNPAARQQLFNVCMDEPVDYGRVATHLADTQGLPHVEIASDYHSTWLDNSKAKQRLGWRPRYDQQRLIDEAWSYRRSEDDPRRIWYPG